MGALGSFSLLLVLLIAWSLFWKGFALWHSAKRGEQWWFIAFLILNTAGILEIVYLFFIAKVPEFRKKLGL
ncbi:hypothetical protein A3C21_03315 [Candidatus Kaiserbacteria bacterium RIFCSPHIGHO2_02_FULL_59_21]|nr:MAG: hypothetical protein A2766_00275 [Candidatus Kaiserbacteria bacterium RIFCSPHIGHO2_01_FULL_58_22]OGG66709.1 MAG: hypothetical protein A3C21_03315 [Candidatus Kaiserbacteria bacterium RIFCSPHIGHO2_02_FULL_59_21]OGG79085.1 MAG: hypothetical protein A2952_02780 [Candidatus Kaiserbacteria bacterium RIFCSPLOWO2_01_FULL_59_34]OGG84469.1 MAG: hypothetical protein A3I47_02165 [Candidatus Kaiserbacteria bacterium RIFCSPLOWO2_02_FULL_59_19]